MIIATQKGLKTHALKNTADNIIGIRYHEWYRRIAGRYYGKINYTNIIIYSSLKYSKNNYYTTVYLRTYND